jgi:Recombination endonuclease VII
VPKSRKARDRHWHLLRMAKRVGLTGNAFPPDLARRIFREMLSQDKACCICSAKRGLVADHCHRRNRHRGRLCHPCNTAIGLMKDSPARLIAAAMYLEEFEEQFEQEI